MLETRTLCLTDVVDSTKLATEIGDARNGALWDAHDALARALVAQWRGTELERTDGIMVLFDSPTDALGFAVAYHAAVGTLDPPLVARAGIHTGPLAIRPNPAEHTARGAKRLEVDGLAIAITARVMSVAVGGQTLVTFIPEAPLRTVSHGHWQLKGIANPVELFEVGLVGTSPLPPPPDAAKAWRVVWRNDTWLPVRDIPHSLPAQRDAFVGRETELQDLARCLDEGSRLVSVLGIGGTGKTRLVTRYGWSWLGEWPGGVWFCDLSEARDVDGIASAVAQSLEVPLGKSDVMDQLGHAIAGRGKCLMLLDNFEQVVREAPATVGRWLDRAAEATFVVTTREVLGLPGEAALALSPLPAAEGAALFVARARAAKSDFKLAEGDHAHVDALVRLLDGLPLAIELAAARVRIIPPAALLQRMSERFKLLSSSGGRHTRQATLRATLDWSWDLLSADERSALAQLSTFEGGFTLDAAEAVLVLAETFGMDAVQALVDKSLLRRVSEERFDLLVSVQVYAAEKLGPAERVAVETRHGRYFASFGTTAALDALDRHGGVARRKALAQDLGNLLAATRRAVARRDDEVSASALETAWAVLALTGPYGVAADLAGTVPGPGAASVRAQALRELGRPADARIHYESALAAFRATGDRRAESRVRCHMGSVERDQGNAAAAQAHLEAALQGLREVGDRPGEGLALGSLGTLHVMSGRVDLALAHYHQALGVLREVGDRRLEGVVLGNLGNVCKDHGRPDEAHAHYEEALAVHREVGNRRSEALVLGNVGALLLSQGRLDEARALHELGLALHRAVGSRPDEGSAIGNLGILHHMMGRLDDAGTHYDAALAIHREVGRRGMEAAVLGNRGALHLEQGRHREARADLEAALATHRELGDLRLQGSVLATLGRLHMALGEPDAARASFVAGESLLRGASHFSVLAELLIRWAQLELDGGDGDLARRLIDEAAQLAAAAGAGPDSEIGRLLGALPQR